MSDRGTLLKQVQSLSLFLLLSPCIQLPHWRVAFSCHQVESLALSFVLSSLTTASLLVYIYQLAFHASNCGVFLKAMGTATMAEIIGIRAKMRSGLESSGGIIATFDCHRLSNRYPGPIARTLEISGKHILEREQETYHITSGRALKDIVNIIRHHDEPNKCTIFFRNQVREENIVHTSLLFSTSVSLLSLSLSLSLFFLSLFYLSHSLTITLVYFPGTENLPLQSGRHYLS